MRLLIIGILLILFSCSPKKDATEEDQSVADTTAPTLSDSVTVEPKVEIVQMDYPLDSLLKFNTEDELKKAFGSNVKRSIGYYPEGMGEYQNTLLYPGTPNEVEFVWIDDSLEFTGLAYIQVNGHATGWRTKEGITLGTRLKELEKLNQKPFTFYGFGWDYSGMVDWQDGHLYDRKVFVSLGYPEGNISPEFEDLSGDHELRSDADLVQRCNPVVCELTLRRE